MITNNDGNTKLELVLTNALKVPGVKVNRKEFLARTLADHISSKDLSIVMEKGPIAAGMSIDKIDKIAKSLIEKRTLQSSSASFAAGLPGGFAMAATVPADTLQFFGIALRLAQELAYLFGFKDMWEEEELNMDKVKGELTLFLGVMFSVGGSASAVKVLSSKVAQQMLKKLPQKALTKTLYYPIIKKVAATIGIKITKKTFAQGISKAVPLLGGIVSGGLTYASMKPMGSRLRTTLYESVDNYSQEDFNKDFYEMKKEMSDVIDADFSEIEASIQDKVTESTRFSVADELIKFKQLLDMGVVTQEEFDKKKEELLFSQK
ncbi:SHOCT domain-containing protein [Actinomycetes bacterium NPDC127524]